MALKYTHIVTFSKPIFHVVVVLWVQQARQQKVSCHCTTDVLHVEYTHNLSKIVILNEYARLRIYFAILPKTTIVSATFY